MNYFEQKKKLELNILNIDNEINKLLDIAKPILSNDEWTYTQKSKLSGVMSKLLDMKILLNDIM